MNVRFKNIQEKCFSFVRKSERYILVSEDINFLTFDIIFIKKNDLLVSVNTVCTVLHRNSSSRMDPIKQCLSWRISVSDCLTFEKSSPSFKNTDPIDVLHSNASAKFLNLSRDGHSCF